MFILLVIVVGIVAYLVKEHGGVNFQTGDSNVAWIVGGVVLFILFIVFVIALSNSDHESKTDGVYESATQKMDEGIPLNDREEKRIKDILNLKDDKDRAKEIEHRNGER